MSNWFETDRHDGTGDAAGRRLDTLLDELKDGADAPPGLVNEVMAKVASGTKPTVYRTTGETRMAKKAFIGLAAAAALTIMVFAATGWPPSIPGTEGAIGAAKRHQGQQMTAADVKLGDTSTQEFLQSDVVARLLADPAARAAFADPNLRAALAD